MLFKTRLQKSVVVCNTASVAHPALLKPKYCNLNIVLTIIYGLNNMVCSALTLGRILFITIKLYYGKKPRGKGLIRASACT